MRIKALVLAETCNPEWASLPFFSYSLAMAIAEQVDVVLVTHVRNKAAIEKSGFGRILEVVYVDNEYIASPLFKMANIFRKLKLGSWMMGMGMKYPSYLAFEYEAWKLLKGRIEQKEFDLIHRISPVSPAMPSPMAKWAKVPFVLGPINGGLGWPVGFMKELKREKEYLIFFRNLFKYLPYYQSTYRFSKIILAAFEHVENDIPAHELKKIVRFNELGIDSAVFNSNNRKISSESCHFLFVGRLVPYKNPDVVLQAFLSDPLLYENHRLTIVGDGPDMAILRQILNKEKERGGENVALVGWKSAEEISSLMKDADVFVFPTIREVGGNVILEAMASGLPCIVPEYGGPSELVNDNVGIKLPLDDKPALIASIQSAMLKLANDIELRRMLSINASKYVIDNYSWVEKAKKLKVIYQGLKSSSTR